MFAIAGKNRKKRSASPSSWGYRIHDGAAQFRFQLEGALASADVAELDQCWRTASSTIAGKAFVVDLTSLTAVDESGRQLLNRWRQVGAEFVGGVESRAVLAGQIDGFTVEPGKSRAAAFLGPAFQSALPWLAGLLMLLVAVTTLRAGEPAVALVTVAPGSESADAPNRALARYFAGLDRSQPWGSETVEIEASLPKLKEQGRLRGIRRLLPHGKPQYQVFELDGSRTVKQQVIARYLRAEIESADMAPSAVAVSPANYKFSYAGTMGRDAGLTYVFQITPRQKRAGLFQGVLWIDAQTGSAVRMTGYLVKRPSIFLKRVDVTRETNLRAGVAESRVTHLALDTRLVGRAELTIHERPCVECVDSAVTGSN